MGLLKGIGYTLMSILVIAVVVVGGFILTAAATIFGCILIAVALVTFVAFAIKEYLEGESSDT